VRTACGVSAGPDDHRQVHDLLGILLQTAVPHVLDDAHDLPGTAPADVDGTPDGAAVRPPLLRVRPAHDDAAQTVRAVVRSRRAAVDDADAQRIEVADVHVRQVRERRQLVRPRGMIRQRVRDEVHRSAHRHRRRVARRKHARPRRDALPQLPVELRHRHRIRHLARRHRQLYREDSLLLEARDPRA
jgi:hypothetical protein